MPLTSGEKLKVLLDMGGRGHRLGHALLVPADRAHHTVHHKSLLNTYDSGGLLDTGWIVAYSMVGLAGVMQADLTHRESSRQISPQAQMQPLIHSSHRSILQASQDSMSLQFTWPYYLPYIGAAAAYALLMNSYDHFPSQSISYISWGVGGIIGLIIIRQIVALHENQSLYREAKQAEREVRRLNSELEIR